MKKQQYNSVNLLRIAKTFISKEKVIKRSKNISFKKAKTNPFEYNRVRIVLYCFSFPQVDFLS